MNIAHLQDSALVGYFMSSTGFGLYRILKKLFCCGISGHKIVTVIHHFNGLTRSTESIICDKRNLQATVCPPSLYLCVERRQSDSPGLATFTRVGWVCATAVSE